MDHWNESNGMPDVLPTGYGQGVGMDGAPLSGGPSGSAMPGNPYAQADYSGLAFQNALPGAPYPPNAPPLARHGAPFDRGTGAGMSFPPGGGAGWAGVGSPGYGAADSNPSRMIQDDGGWSYRQYKDDRLIVVTAPRGYESWVGRELSAASYPTHWQAIIAKFGSWKDFKSGQVQNWISTITQGISTAAGSFKASPASAPAPAASSGGGLPPPTQLAPAQSSGGIGWGWWVGGAVLLAGLGFLAFSGGKKKKAEDDE